MRGMLHIQKEFSQNHLDLRVWAQELRHTGVITSSQAEVIEDKISTFLPCTVLFEQKTRKGRCYLTIMYGYAIDKKMWFDVNARARIIRQG